MVTESLPHFEVQFFGGNAPDGWISASNSEAWGANACQVNFQERKLLCFGGQNMPKQKKAKWCKMNAGRQRFSTCLGLPSPGFEASPVERLEHLLPKPCMAAHGPVSGFLSLVKCSQSLPKTFCAHCKAFPRTNIICLYDNIICLYATKYRWRHLLQQPSVLALQLCSDGLFWTRCR